ncbi:hypothetical protein GCM10027051_21890 [Niabella terrae]
MKKKRINLRELQLKRLRFKRLTYRGALLMLGIIATVVIAFNFWFIDHAEEALEQIVYNQSKGKLRLKVGNFRFNWISNKILLQQASIYSTDSTAPVSYAVNTKQIMLKARGFLPLLIRKRLFIDSIRMSAPSVIFTRHTARIKPTRADKDSIRAAGGEETFSVAREMGRITKSITNAIEVLHVDKFRLDNGSFSLVDKTLPAQKPFAVSNIYIQLDNLQFDSSGTGESGTQKIGFTDNIAVRTFNQSIAFPGGRHFISFKDFRVNLQHKRVEFDSCTLRAIRGDSSRTAFRIFFDKLQLTNINFDSLYSSETIIADSVFCNRPQIYLDIDSDQGQVRTQEKKAGFEKVDAVIQQMLGDLELNYVGVKNANIDISTIKHGRASTFSSRDNNFEMYGLTVRPNQNHPITMDRFMMSLHNFENVLGDGRYRISFDSIGFEDKLINLSKFSFREYAGGRAIKSLSMPSFQVRGLSWESLLYENTFSAQSAVFQSPVVDYRAGGGRRKRKPSNIFETLNSIDDVMDLKNLGISNGDITLHFGRRTSLHLQKTNLDLRANDLTNSSRIKNVQRSINELNFEKGVFKRGALTATLRRVRLSENKTGLQASHMEVRSPEINSQASGISIGSVILDSTRQSIVMDGVNWREAAIQLQKQSGSKSGIKADQPRRRGKTRLMLKNIEGGQTRMDLQLGQQSIHGNFQKILMQSFSQDPAGKPQILGLRLEGNGFEWLSPEQRLTVGALSIADQRRSVLHQIAYEKNNQRDSISARIPRLVIIPNITGLMNGQLVLKGLEVTEPVLRARLGRKDPEAAQKPSPKIRIESSLFERPDIQLTIPGNEDAVSQISWNGVKLNSYLRLSGLESSADIPLKADQIKMYLTNFVYRSAKGRKIATNDNKLNFEFNQVLVKKNEKNKLDWKADLNILSLDKLFFDSLGRNNAELRLDKGDIRHLALNSAYIHQPAAVIANSRNLQINGTNGQFKTGKQTLRWEGLTMDHNILGMQSLSLMPHQTVEEYRQGKAFNEDYLKIKTGKIQAGPIDMDLFRQDSILHIGYIQIDDPDLFTFKDKTQPDTAKKYKPLPAEMLRDVNSPLQIDSLRINNMQVTYWEINPNTDSLGIIPVYDLNVLMRDLKNYDIGPQDSIYINASAKVLGHLDTRLDLRQSYSDTSGAMRMQLHTGPMDLGEFNSVLVPLVGARVFAGDLSALDIDATGNNNTAIGTSHMYYRDLKIGLLDKKNLSRQRFVDKIVSKLAMALVIRKQNPGKATPLFFERWKDKSAINYIIKISLEGIKSGIGLPGSKKKLRKYNKRQAAATN